MRCLTPTPTPIAGTYDPAKLKSKICRNIARSGYCAMGYYCTFVHPGEPGYEDKLKEFTDQGGLRGNTHGQEETGRQYVARDVSKTGHDYVRSDDDGSVRCSTTRWIVFAAQRTV